MIADEAWTLEALLDAIKKHTDAAWVNAFEKRYLDFSSLQSGLRMDPL